MIMTAVLVAAALAAQQPDLRDATAVNNLLASLRAADPAVCEMAGRTLTNQWGWGGDLTDGPMPAPMPTPMPCRSPAEARPSRTRTSVIAPAWRWTRKCSPCFVLRCATRAAASAASLRAW